MESKIQASAEQAVPSTSHRIPIPISCCALSLLTLSVDSQRCERSRVLLFSDSFDRRGFIYNPLSIVPGELCSDFDPSSTGPVPQCFSIGYATCFQTASVEEVPYELAKKVVKSCFVSAILNPAFGLDIHVNLVALQYHGESFDGFDCRQ